MPAPMPRHHVGCRDIYAITPLLRLLITVEAGLGFALFSIGITYVLSVYGALLRATALAVHITSFIGRQAGEDAVDVVCRSVKTHMRNRHWPGCVRSCPSWPPPLRRRRSIH